MKKRTIALMIAVLVIMLVGSSNGASVSTEVRKKAFVIAHNAAEGGAYDTACKKIAELMSKYSGGKMTLEIQGNGSLGTEPETLELAKSGSIHMTICGASTMATSVKSMNVFNLPYLFKDYSHVQRFMGSNAVDKMIKNAYDNGGVIVFKPFLVDGFRVFFNSKKKVVTPQDLAGLKIRTPAWPILIGTVKAFGANPVSLNWGEVFLAISSGTVDGAESLAPTILSNKMYEVAKYLCKDFHQYSPACICVNPRIYKSLNDAEKDIFDRAVVEGSQYEVKWAIENDNSFYEQLAKKGMTITEVDLDIWAAAAAPVWKTFADQVDQSLVDAIQKLR